MTNNIKKNEWWDKQGIRFLDGESGSHIPTTEDFARFGYDSGYQQGWEDFRIHIMDAMHSSIAIKQIPSDTKPQNDE